jgi:hypothetical protein
VTLVAGSRKQDDRDDGERERDGESTDQGVYAVARKGGDKQCESQADGEQSDGCSGDVEKRRGDDYERRRGRDSQAPEHARGIISCIRGQVGVSSAVLPVRNTASDVAR